MLYSVVKLVYDGTGVPMIKEEQVTFRLRYFCRYDDEVRAFVGYIPRLQVFSQSPTEEGLKKATEKTALRFILACTDRQILGRVMKESQMRELSASEAEAAQSCEEWEFVSVNGYKECADPIEITIPLSVMAAHQDAVAV